MSMHRTNYVTVQSKCVESVSIIVFVNEMIYVLIDQDLQDKGLHMPDPDND